MSKTINIPVEQAKILTDLLRQINVDSFVSVYNRMTKEERAALTGRYMEVLTQPSLSFTIKNICNTFDNEGLSTVSWLNDLCEYISDAAISVIKIDLYTLRLTKQLLEDWRTINGEV
ncbi:hypothetical protein ABNavy71_012 [Acinetobacter phage AB-Navy71]|uniref:Uncharacterized protein n=1 Tax=Acinetobacter phage AbTZA1 TaxID=2500827 RepID=A0A3T0IGX7_9CAUD|nr:hypothetical protein HYP74_gp084 [Acinetobacter phage AbTZA1]AZU98670.1 hypothetical protein [Acinetobacter phage AbTZA1]QQM13749.1 hypothetical protein CPT_Maestro_015 [Acinetobacter phage Maestro]QQM18507.1 hypothetical protein CPT_Morttis_014 [Acinetobacter phage Morttis]UQS94089.1 hypothetical protein ABNavy71_012 [Acinetobacter phage AB-Navy71]